MPVGATSRSTVRGAGCERARPRYAAPAVVAASLFAVILLALSPVASASEGTVRAFGKNGQGELGVGFQDNQEISAATLPKLANVTQIAQGFNFTVALLSNGTLQTWGENNYGQLGLGAVKEPIRCLSPQPVTVESGEKVIAVAAAGVHAIALTEGHKVLTWGTTQVGEAGTGESGVGAGEEEEPPPEEEPLEKGIVETKTFGLDAAGCEEAEPLKSSKAVPAPTEVKSLSPSALTSTFKQGLSVEEVAAGGKSDYVRLSNGTMEAWGYNDDGQLAQPKSTTTEFELCKYKEPQPEKPEKPENPTKEQEKEYKEALAKYKTEHKAWIERRNEFYYASAPECPNLCLSEEGVEPCRTTPHVVDAIAHTVGEEKSLTPAEEMSRALPNVEEIAAGEEDAYAIAQCTKEKGREVPPYRCIMSWGNNGKGELGTGSAVKEEPWPKPVESLKGVKEIAAGNHQVLATVSTESTVYGWGNAGGGDLGPNAGSGTVAKPVPIGGLKGAPELIAAGRDDSFVVTGGKIYAFGNNESGELGIGSTVNSTKNPTAVPGIEHVIQIGASEQRTSVLAGGTAPAPLLEVTPEAGKISVRWNLPAPKVKLREHACSFPEAPEGDCVLEPWSAFETVTVKEPKEAVFYWPDSKQQKKENLTKLPAGRYRVNIDEVGTRSEGSREENRTTWTVVPGA
jgi:alpha-tubulin suppressor-like RCC1 family protein